jgi:ammonium transporter Rh
MYVVFAVQIIIIIVVFATNVFAYPTVDVACGATSMLSSSCYAQAEDTPIQGLLLAHVALLVYVGFGQLRSFLKRHMIGSVALTILIGAVCLQLTLVLQGPILKGGGGLASLPYALSTGDLLMGMFGTATCLISFGAVVGVASPLQVIMMCLIEIPLWLLNQWIAVHQLSPSAPGMGGGGIMVHMFGAYFGLAMSRVLCPANDPRIEKNRLKSSSYTSEMFSLCGAVFMLVLWPSLNAAAASPLLKYRIISCTVLSISGSTISGFATSFMLGGNRGIWLDVQQAVLAGGVAAGALAELDMTNPAISLIIGVVAGALCIVGFRLLSGFLESALNLHDSAGVHNLHGLPSLFGAVVAVILCKFATPPDAQNFQISEYSWRSQLIAIAVTLGISLGGGGVAGAVMRLLPQPIEAAFFNDAQCWNIPDVDFSASPSPQSYLVAVVNGAKSVGTQCAAAQPLLLRLPVGFAQAGFHCLQVGHLLNWIAPLCGGSVYRRCPFFCAELRHISAVVLWLDTFIT